MFPILSFPFPLFIYLFCLLYFVAQEDATTQRRGRRPGEPNGSGGGIRDDHTLRNRRYHHRTGGKRRRWGPLRALKRIAKVIFCLQHWYVFRRRPQIREHGGAIAVCGTNRTGSIGVVIQKPLWVNMICRHGGPTIVFGRIKV